jgi:hypothetical protein
VEIERSHLQSIHFRPAKFGFDLSQFALNIRISGHCRELIFNALPPLCLPADALCEPFQKLNLFEKG